MQRRTEKQYQDEWEAIVDVNGYRIEWEYPAQNFADALRKANEIGELLELTNHELVSLRKTSGDIPF